MRLEYRGPEVALHFLGLLLVALSLHQALGSPSATSRTRQQPPRPNVILISVDTLRADHLGTYGYDSPTSPRIDAFAKEGVVFENAMAPTPATLPSHTTLFTGLSPGTHGILTNRRRRAAPGLLTMAELLRSGGLRTASINDGAYLGRGFGLDQGFQFFDTIPDAVAETRTVATTLSDRAKKALAWLDASPPGEFFLFVHSYEVHIPLTPPTQALARFPVDPGYEGPIGDSILLPQWYRWTNAISDPADARPWIRIYDAAIRSADEGLAEFLAGLRERGLYEDSLIILLSDHGEELGERTGFSLHGKTLFDEVLRIPLIIKFPGGAFAGRRVRNQVRLMDVMPTVLQVLGLPIPENLEGRSLLPSIERPDRDGIRPAIARVGSEQLSIRLPPWKLYREDETTKLFHLDRDPGELRDLAADNPSVLDSLRVATEHMRQIDFQAVGRARRPGSNPALRKKLEALGYVE